MESSIEKGRRSFDWARLHMPAFRIAEDHVRKEIQKRKLKDLFSGRHIVACLHVSKETAVLLESLRMMGLEITLVAANPLSSQAEIAAFLSSQGINVDAEPRETVKEYKECIKRAANSNPDLIIDDGGELHVAYSKTKSKSCFGGTDETTSGTTRLRALAKQGKLRYPVIAVNEARSKHIFDNKYGSGQSAIDGLLRATGVLLASRVVVVAGYGWVGRGVALRARGAGARVLVTEVDPIRAIEAHMEGYEVLTMDQASEKGEIFLTCTGQVDVIRREHIQRMQDGAILANVGHFDREIDVPSLYEMAERVEQIKENVVKFELPQKKSIFLLCQGRVVNLVAGEGHPPEVMQISFAIQLMSVYHLLTMSPKSRVARVFFPSEIDSAVASFALEGFGISVDELNSKQKRYANSA